MIQTNNHKETVLLGEQIGKSLKPDDVIALSGELGAGKTTLIQGMAKGLGIRNWVTSPTFTIINEFHGKYDLFHVDLYRLNSVEEAEDMAIEEYFVKGGITVIEWAEKIRSILPPGAIKIHMKIISENKRNITIKGLKL